MEYNSQKSTIPNNNNNAIYNNDNIIKNSDNYTSRHVTHPRNEENGESVAATDDNDGDD
ncbi:2022_t:CDS:2 [Diversispora eburnea]|uniref:2022_t:CDS:1 n=1 Tax=Diversispora eburnea TaxID=1213867 RepID=A0A9N9ALX7_9GLOM|nr:2022_t:CDS:2 [Diversispora eburnea]